LHENGAERVNFRPLMNADGSYLFCSREVSAPARNGGTRTTGCYFVRVEIEIDGDKWEYDYPLLNGANAVYDDTLNQRAINTAHARAFVKAVAIRTGLGWSLWAGDDDGEVNEEENLAFHNPLMVQKRMQERVSFLMQKGMSLDAIAQAIGWKRNVMENVLTRYFDGIVSLEAALKKL
jgi:hypothetical protein